MYAAPLPLVREVVLVGGGHTHALVLRRWGMRPLAGARLTLINPDPTAPYTGMLPGYVAGHYPREALEIDLVRLARHAGARLILGRAEAIDRARREIRVSGRPAVRYDVASLDIGVTSAMPELPGFAEHAVAAKPLGALADAWARFVADPPAAPRMAVIGGGVAGIELALAMAWRLRDRSPRVAVVDAGRALRRSHSPRTPAAAAAGSSRRDRADRGCKGDCGEGRRAAPRRTASCRRVSPWAPRGRGRTAGWQTTGLDLTAGYVTVDDALRAANDPTIYAVGDCAHLAHAPRPKAGVFAVREAPTLHANLRADLTGAARRRFRPQRDYLKLISLGRQAALAEKWGFAVAAPVLWRWKDRIDRRFMARFADLAPMPPAATAARARRRSCHRARAKAAAAAAAVPRWAATRLGAALGGRRRRRGRSSTTGGARQVLSTDHLRAVTDDPWSWRASPRNTRSATSGRWAHGRRRRLPPSSCRG